MAGLIECFCIKSLCDARRGPGWDRRRTRMSAPEGARDLKMQLDQWSAGSPYDPGRVKTQKGRLRRGIAFCRRCEFRVVLLPVARTLRWRGRSFYAFLTLRRFRTAKTQLRHW